MRYKAIHRFADMSARKIRPFAALIRNRPVDEAMELLKFLPNKSATRWTIRLALRWRRSRHAQHSHQNPRRWPRRESLQAP